MAAAALPGRVHRWLRRQLVDPEPPAVAVEVRSRALGVVRLGRTRPPRLEAAVSLELPPGALSLSITQPSLADPEAFGRVLRAALERAGVLHGARVGLVLPDPVVRIALWPAADLASRSRERSEDMVRFKLRKSVPFDLKDARIDVAFEPGSEQALVVAVAGPVLRGYEAACAALHLEAGLVEPTVLALLGALPVEASGGDVLLVTWDEGYLTLLLARQGWPVLVRTLAGESASQAAGVVREISNTLVYYRERLGGDAPGACLVRAAGRELPAALAALAESLPCAPRPAEPWRESGLAAPPEVAQEVAGALSCLAWVNAR